MLILARLKALTTIKMNETLAAEGLFDPNEWGVSVAATFGYRARDITKKSRRPIEEIVTWVE